MSVVVKTQSIFAMALILLSGCGASSRSPERSDASVADGIDGSRGSEERTIDLAALGKRIFEDTMLSDPKGVGCQTCHDSNAGFADPRGGFVSAGAVDGLVGNRNAPTVAYTSFVPPLTLVDFVENGETDTDYIGGVFWDGRADTLEIQALAPIRNHLEENSSEDSVLVSALAAADYAPEIERLFGAATLENEAAALGALSSSVAAFERSPEVNRFSSRYDRFLRGEETLSEEEALGLALFEDDDKGNCAACHVTTPMGNGGPVLFTDHTYDNIGIPTNEASPFLDLGPENNPDGRDYVDLGLFSTTGRSEDVGRFRVPTLRNVAMTAPYGHNGFFATLEDVVHFYNTKSDGSFGPPEVPSTENDEELGALGLTAEEEAAIVAFLKTLTDE